LFLYFAPAFYWIGSLIPNRNVELASFAFKTAKAASFAMVWTWLLWRRYDEAVRKDNSAKEQASGNVIRIPPLVLFGRPWVGQWLIGFAAVVIIPLVCRVIMGRPPFLVTVCWSLLVPTGISAGFRLIDHAMLNGALERRPPSA
jgi:hypothetical protein